MRKKPEDFSFVQQGTPWGGSLNMLQPDYEISIQPLGNVKKWGHLAFVSEETRNKILAAGSGEMKAHIEHIKRRVGTLKKLKGCGKPKQITMDL